MNRPISVLSDRGWAALSSLPITYRRVGEEAAVALIDGAAVQWTAAAAQAIERGLDLIVFSPSMAPSDELFSLCAAVDAREGTCIVVPPWSARQMPFVDTRPRFDYVDIRISGTRAALGGDTTALLRSALLVESLGLTAPSAWSTSECGHVASADLGEQGALTVVFHKSALAPEPGVAIRAVRGATVLELDLPISGDGAPSRARRLEPLQSIEATPVYESAFRRGLIAAAAALESTVRTNDMGRLADLARVIESSSGLS